jgi:hypothetical protein
MMMYSRGRWSRDLVIRDVGLRGAFVGLRLAIEREA